MKSALRLVLSALLGAALLALLMVWGKVAPREVARTLTSLPPGTYALALGMHMGVYCARVVRFRMLLPRPGRPSFGAVMAVSASHNLASYVLPAKSGEATFVLYLKGLCGTSGAAGLASLLVSRLYDFAVMCGALCATTLWLTTTPHWHAHAGLGLSIALALGCASAAFLTLALRGEKALGPLRLALRALRLEGTRVGQKVSTLIQKAALALQQARTGASVPFLLFVTGLIWLGIFGFYALLARGFGLPPRIGMKEATFASGLAVMSNILPINAFAGFGTQETGWVLGFGLLGVSREAAFATGLAVHLVQLFNVCAMGFLGHVAMGLLPRRSSAKPVEPPAAPPSAP